jgi:carbonic anhydrase
MTDSTNNNAVVLSLLKRYQQFRQEHFEEKKTFAQLVEQGQKPKVLMIACCDSRVDPALLTHAYPGELFVVRNIANLVPSQHQLDQDVSVAAALEYGVMHLNVTDIIILGHRHCGGIRALLEDNSDKPKDSAIKWVRIAQNAKEKVLSEHTNSSFKEQLKLLEKESLKLSYKNLETFSFIKERMTKNQLRVHAWFFNLDTGEIEATNESFA